MNLIYFWVIAFLILGVFELGWMFFFGTTLTTNELINRNITAAFFFTVLIALNEIKEKLK